MIDSGPGVPGTTPARARHRRVWLAVGTVLTAAVLLTGAVGVLGAVGVTAPSDAPHTERESRTYPRPAARVEMSMASGTTRVVGGDTARVEVERELTWSGDRPRVDETWHGDTLRVETQCRDPFPRWAWDGCEVDYTAAVPHDAAVDVRTDTGAIDARGLGGELALRSLTGSISVEDASGSLSAETSTGEIAGSGLRSPRAQAGVTTGTIDLRFAEPPDRVVASATTGTVHIKVPRGGSYRVEVSTTTGARDVQVVQDPAAERTIEVTTTTGDVHVGYGS